MMLAVLLIAALHSPAQIATSSRQDLAWTANQPLRDCPLGWSRGQLLGRVVGADKLVSICSRPFEGPSLPRFECPSGFHEEDVYVSPGSVCLSDGAKVYECHRFLHEVVTITCARGAVGQ